MIIRRYEVALTHHFINRDSGQRVTERRIVGRYFRLPAARRRLQFTNFFDRCGGGYTIASVTDRREGKQLLERVL